VVEGYETERERERRLAKERLESARAAERARRETFDAVRRELPGAFERLRATPPDCMIEVMGWRLWRREPVVKRRVPGWFIGTAAFEWARRASGYSGLRVSYAIGNDRRLYMGGRGVGDRREFKTVVPEFRFESLAQLATEALQELLEQLQAAGARRTDSPSEA
jgi:hypothetical protein